MHIQKLQVIQINYSKAVILCQSYTHVMSSCTCTPHVIRFFPKWKEKKINQQQKHKLQNNRIISQWCHLNFYTVKIVKINRGKAHFIRRLLFRTLLVLIWISIIFHGLYILLGKQVSLLYVLSYSYLKTVSCRKQWCSVSVFAVTAWVRITLQAPNQLKISTYACKHQADTRKNFEFDLKKNNSYF